MHPRDPLPIDSHLEAIAGSLQKNNRLVLIASPGSGKSTRLPAYLCFQHRLRCLVLEPRRSAVRALCKRVADENQLQVGEEVGYQVRFENRSSARTRLKFITEALLLRELERDLSLSDWDLVVIDEFHERSLFTDLALPLLMESQILNPKLRILVMSATLQKEWLEQKLQTQALELPGRVHPLTEIFEPGSSLDLQTARLSTQVPEVLRKYRARVPEGDFLVFLPGTAEIRDCLQELKSRAEFFDFEIRELHGQLPLETQMQLLNPTSSRRRIILSTNLAESSVTLPRLRCVIDSGLERKIRFNPELRLERLETCRISKASATQRAGRAARTGPGLVVRLWSAAEHQRLEEEREPEILNKDLIDTVVRLEDLGHADPRRFPWLTPPPNRNLESATQYRSMLPLKKLDSALSYPFEFRLGAVLNELKESGFELEGWLFAYWLSELSDGQDLTDGLERLSHGPPAPLEKLIRSRGLAFHRPAPFEEWGHAVIPYFFDRVFFRKSQQDGVLVGGRGVLFDTHLDPGADSFAVALEVRELKRHDGMWARVHRLQKIPREWLLNSRLTQTRREIDLDTCPPRIRVQRCFVDLPVEKERFEGRTPEDDLAWARHQLSWSRFWDSNEGRALDSKIKIAKKLGWPMASLGELQWQEWLQQSSLTARYESPDPAQDLRQRWTTHLPSMDTTGEWRRLSKSFPDEWIFPNGRKTRLHYTPEAQIRLESRVQDFFGMASTPRLEGYPLTLVLLNPGRKPLQITQDLNSFWTQTYPQLKKQLRIDYPKHHWPDDPIKAG
jgi:ATP-dependent helicase HrpB